MDNEMVVKFPGGKRVDAHYQGFHIQTDQHPRFGGDGSGLEGITSSFSKGLPWMNASGPSWKILNPRVLPK